MQLQLVCDHIKTPFQISRDHAETFHEYTQKKLARESRRSYSFGWKKFQGWLTQHGYQLYHDSNHIAFLTGAFLSDMAKSGILKYRSLVSYHAAIKTYVREIYRIELDHQEIRSAMKGIRNDLKQAPVKKEAIKSEHISSMLSKTSESNRLIDLRNKALLLLGFSGAFRRSELVGIDLEHISFEKSGISICIPYSKTDQAGMGQHVEIPWRLHSENCAISALNKWLEASEIKSGPVFRAINRHGKISLARLNGKSVAVLLKNMSQTTFENTKNIAGHSLRRGFVMSSLEADVSLVSIMNQTRHASVNTLKEYSCDKKNYKINALNFIDL